MAGKKRFHGQTLRVRLTADLDKWLKGIQRKRPTSTLSDVARDVLEERRAIRHKA